MTQSDLQRLSYYLRHAEQLRAKGSSDGAIITILVNNDCTQADAQAIVAYLSGGKVLDPAPQPSPWQQRQAPAGGGTQAPSPPFDDEKLAKMASKAGFMLFDMNKSHAQTRQELLNLGCDEDMAEQAIKRARAQYKQSMHSSSGGSGISVWGVIGIILLLAKVVFWLVRS